MADILFRSAVSPLRRQFDPGETALPSIDDVVATERPSEPIHCLRPATLRAAAEAFVQRFPGEVLYAVKCNPDPRVLRRLWQGGIRHFDCASPAEIALVRQMFPEAEIHYMHPVKSREAIRTAAASHGVTDFALDTFAELTKILDETRAPRPVDERGRLGLFVRLAVDGRRARHDLSGKFGAAVDDAVRLLMAARPFATTLGVCFHVGSQCLDPAAWRDALRLAHEAIDRSGVAVDAIDVGGGFPVAYADQSPPPLHSYIDEIADAARRLGDNRYRLWAEPGRALVAAGVSVVVQVQLRRGDVLYINDGVYGSLSDAGQPGLRYPVRLIRPGFGGFADAFRPYRLFGPTCDSLDAMAGPFVLPADVEEGDWIEIGQTGAYGSALRTAFNGFDRARLVEVCDPPLIDAQDTAPL
jgi:ornithine decarboxylase